MNLEKSCLHFMFLKYLCFSEFREIISSINFLKKLCFNEFREIILTDVFKVCVFHRI